MRDERIVMRDEALAGQRVDDDVVVTVARTGINDGARHLQRVGHGEPEDVHLRQIDVREFASQRCLFIEEHVVGIGVEELLQLIARNNAQYILVAFEHKGC